MKPIDFAAELVPGVGIAPQAFSGTTEVDGTGLDVSLYGGGVVTCITGAASGAPTAQSIAFTVQESDDNGSSDAWATQKDADGNDVTVTIDAVNTVKQLRLDLGRSKKYIRVKGVPAFTGGTSPTLLGAATLSLGDRKYVS